MAQERKTAEPLIRKEHLLAADAARNTVTARTSSTHTVPLENELQRARALVREANQSIANLVATAKNGSSLDMGSLEDIVERMSDSISRNPDALISLCMIKSKDDYTNMHAVSVGILMLAFARAMDKDQDQMKQMGMGGMCLDIGKCMLPHKILTKQAKLTNDEYEKVKAHVAYSYQILSDAHHTSKTLLQIATQHHERYDGTGYPRGLDYREISEAGQMAAIADCYDAMTSTRCYQKAGHPTDTLKSMVGMRNTQFDEKLLSDFVRCVGIYPVGTLLALSNGKLAVVVEQNAEHLLTPFVRTIYDLRKRAYTVASDLDLHDAGKTQGIRVISHIPAEKVHINPHMFLQ